MYGVSPINGPVFMVWENTSLLQVYVHYQITNHKITKSSYISVILCRIKKIWALLYIDNYSDFIFELNSYDDLEKFKLISDLNSNEALKIKLNNEK